MFFNLNFKVPQLARFKFNSMEDTYGESFNCSWNHENVYNDTMAI